MCVPTTETLRTVKVAFTRVNAFADVAPYVRPVVAVTVSVDETPEEIFAESVRLGVRNPAAPVAPVPSTLTVKDSLAAVEVIEAVIVTVEVSFATFESVDALSDTAPDPVTAA